MLAAFPVGRRPPTAAGRGRGRRRRGGRAAARRRVGVVRRRWPLPRRGRASAPSGTAPFTRLTRRRSRNDHPDRPRPPRTTPPRTSLLGAHLLVDGGRLRVRLDGRPAGGGRATPPRLPPGPLLAVAGRATRATTDLLLGSPIILYDHPQVAAESAGRAVRRDRDRRDPHPAGDDDDRRGEGRGPGHRPAGRRDHRPLRRHVARRPAAAARRLPRPARRRPASSRATTLVGPGRPTPRSTRRPTPSSSAGVRVRAGAAWCGCTRTAAPTRRTCSSPTRSPG